MKRGELWTASGRADYAGKLRPVLIVQDDAFAETGSITVCPLTTHRLDVGIVRPGIEPSPENGPREISYAMADKVTTIPRERLGQRIGALSPAAMVPVSRAITVFLGLTRTARR